MALLRRIRFSLWPLLVICGVVSLSTLAARTGSGRSEPAGLPPTAEADKSFQSTLDKVNAELARLATERGVTPTEPVDEFTLLRRFSLALHGTLPSLQEIRAFEQDTAPQRLERRLAHMFEDPRFHAYFAERLARGYVGVDGGQFLIFRRDRFLSWLRKQLRDQRPYDQLVREMVAGTGVWTGKGQVNFITAAYADDEFDPNQLTARTMRAFLGQRIDCAQCHDHPFDRWKQRDFHGFTAHFSQVKLSLAGVIDDAQLEHQYEDGSSYETVEMPPTVPFSPEWLGTSGTRREQLARWLTHPENRRFERATVNRVWGILFGTPFVVDRPVDDLPDPDTDPSTQLLDLLGADFRASGYNLRRLIRLILASDAYLRRSQTPTVVAAEIPEPPLEALRESWAIFPLVRLRPEQVIGAMLQANHVRTIDQNSHVLMRLIRFARERDFVDEFGDPGIEELQERSGTIPQALLRMNGEFARELSATTPFAAPGRISFVSGSPEKKIESAYLACLTRYPTPAELDYFVQQFAESDPKELMEDLYWILFNSPEFSWNH